MYQVNIILYFILPILLSIKGDGLMKRIPRVVVAGLLVCLIAVVLFSKRQ